MVRQQQCRTTKIVGNHSYVGASISAEIANRRIKSRQQHEKLRINTIKSSMNY